MADEDNQQSSAVGNDSVYRSILRAGFDWSRRCWEAVRDFLVEEDRPPSLPGWNGKMTPIDPAYAEIHELPPTAPHDVRVTIVRNMQSAVIGPGESLTLLQTYVDVDPQLADERSTRKLIQRKLQAKIALERGPTAFDELMITIAIMFAPEAKRAARLNGVRIQLHKYIERYGLGYGRWFFLRDIAKHTKIMRRIGSACRLAKPGAGAKPAEEITPKTGAFIPAGNTFDAFKAVRRVFEEAKADILIVDPYLDEKILIDFALLAPSGVPLRLLTDSGSHSPSLIPAITHFRKQYGNHRPVEARAAPARSLHDRMVAIDRRRIWTVGQSFNALATRAPTSFVEVDQETAVLKMAAYEAIWATATPISAQAGVSPSAPSLNPQRSPP